MAIDITRAFLVKKVTTIAFDSNGFFKSVAVDKPSELAAMASLPADILGAIGDSLALRVKTLETQIGMANAEAELIKAQAQLANAQAAYEASVREGTDAAVGLRTGTIRAPGHSGGSMEQGEGPNEDGPNDAGISAKKPGARRP